jgi:hypothetical protein
MPFTTQTPRPFSKVDVESLNLNQMGVYGLYRQGIWIYIGKGDIRQRLLDHIIGDNPCISRNNPTHWVAEVTANMDVREKQLLLEFNPTCNQRFG